MSKREKNSLFARLARWKEQLRLNREQKQAVKAEKSAQIMAEKETKAEKRAKKEKAAQKCAATQNFAGYSAGKSEKQGWLKNPELMHKTVLGALCLILACSVLSLTVATVAKYTREVTHGGNSVHVTGHTGEWVQTQAGVKEDYNNGTLHGAFSPAQHTRTCTVCGAVETKYVFDNAIHNGDFPVSYTNEGSWDVYDRENRLLNHSPNTIDYNLTNWVGYHLDETWATVNVAATKDTDTFYVGDNTGAVVIANGSVSNAISLCNRFILVEGFTYRIGFWCKYEDVLYTTSSNLIMAVRKYSNGKWETVADLKLSDDDSKTPFFQMGVSEKGWTYVTSTFTFADDGDNVKLEQESFDLLLQLYQIQIGRMVIDEVSCYPVTHTPENEKDEQYYTRYETDRFNVPNFVVLQNGSGAYQADLGTSGVDAAKTQITYSVAEGSGYSLTNGNKTLTFTNDGIYTVTAHFATENVHGNHSHTKTVDITQTVKVRSSSETVTVIYYDENGTWLDTGSMANGIGKTITPNTMGLSKAGYRLDGWYYEEDGQFAYLHKNESLTLKDYTVTLKPRYTQLIYDEEIYGAITTDQETGAYQEAYDFGNKDMWAGWTNKTGMVSFQSGDIDNWNDDKVILSSPNYGDGKTAHNAHYHYAMDLQRGVTYYLSGRIQIGNAVIKNVGACELWFGITETSADSPRATPTNVVCQLDTYVGQGKSLSNYDEYVLQTFTVPEDGMYFFSIFAWGVLELTDVTLSQFSIRGAEAGDAKVNFAGYSSLITTKVGKTAYLPYISIPGKKVEGWQQRVPVRGNETNTFIYPMGIQLWANVKGNFTEYIPYITKTYEYGSIASSNNLLKDFGTRPGALYTDDRPLKNSLEWNTFGESDANASAVWDAVNHTATFQVDYLGKVFTDKQEQKSKSGYYNYPVYLEAGKSYVLKTTISFDEFYYNTSGSCGASVTVFGGRYIGETFNTSSDDNYYTVESRICPILGYDSGTYGNTIQSPGKLLTNGSQDFATTFTAPETKTYYVCFRVWGCLVATNLAFSNVSLTAVEMNAAQSEYNYLGITGNGTIDASIMNDTSGWTSSSIKYSECVTYNNATNSINLNFNKMTHDGTSWSGNHEWAYLQKKVHLTKGTYELSAEFTIRKMALSTGGGAIFQMFLSTNSQFGNGTADDTGYLIHGSAMGWAPKTYTSNMPAVEGGTKIEPLYHATRKTHFSISAEGDFYFYLQMWAPYYLDATITDIAIKPCYNNEKMDQVVDRIAGAVAWDFKWDNDGDHWPANVSTDTLIVNGDYTEENTKLLAEGKEKAAFAAVAVKSVYLTAGVRYKLSATFSVSQFIPYRDNSGARMEVFLADMGQLQDNQYGSSTVNNRIQSSAIGYEIEDAYDYALIPYRGAVSDQNLTSYYVPQRSGEFLLVFRCWNAEIATANISKIRLTPVAEDNMIPPVNNAKNWQTTNGSGLWVGDGTTQYTMLEQSSGTLVVSATAYKGSGNYRYGGNYIMGSMPVTLKKGVNYRLSFTMGIEGNFGLLQTAVSNSGEEPAFAGFMVKNVKSGQSLENEITLVKLGYVGGTYTNKDYLQYENDVLSSFLGSYTDNRIETGLHAFSGEFTPTESGIYYVHFNLWAFTSGTIRLYSASLVEV